MIAPGSVFGPYRVIEKIGAGGMGDVYRALDTRLEREVALKLISDNFLIAEPGAASPSPAGTPHSRVHLSQERFLREARAAATLNHPNICAIHDVGEQDGQPYLVMELLRGETLKQYLNRHTLSAAEVVTLGAQAASALAAAHARGIVHRDIKPANLFVVDSGRDRKQLKILDFGLAKKQGAEASPDSRIFDTQASAGATGTLDLTTPGSTVGTAAYMSPEQAKGDPLDARTDLFSLGSVLFEMATGHAPFGGRSTAEVFAALLMKDPPTVSSVNPAMPGSLDPVIARLLAKNRDQRYAGAEELLADLEAVTSPATASAPKLSASSLPPAAAATTAGGRSRTRLIGIGALLLVACAAGLFHYRTRSHAALPAQAGFASTPAAVPAAAQAIAANGKAAPLKDGIIVADFINKTGDPVFDTTLNQALRAQLGQSPVLDIISEQHLRQSLQYLGRKQDDVITPQIAREIGEREGVKAILTGSVAPLGRAYVLTLTAQNTANGDDIASEEATAPDKEHVLEALNTVSVNMRGKLGESLSSIQRLNAPFGQATTPSLEAFRAYALGDEAHEKGDDIPEAQDHYKRALELDPKLAMAWARLGVIRLNTGAVSEASEYFARAWQLSGDVSEREKFYIDGHYYSNVVGDLNKSIETLQVATQEYPLQLDNFINLGVFYLLNGEIEKSREATRQALALQPDDSVALENSISGASMLDDTAGGAKYIADAKRIGLNGTSLLFTEAQYYASQQDWNGVQKILTETAGRPDQFTMTGGWAQILPQLGQIQQARATFMRAADQAASVQAKDAQADALLSAASAGWMVDRCFDPEKTVKDALKLDKGKVTQIAAATALAACNESKPATKMLLDLEKRYPQDTLVRELAVPQSLAMLAIKAGDSSRALALLDRVRAHDDASFAPYLRGLAHLQQKDARSAIVSFQKATRYRGLAYYFGSPYALSYLGLARAYAMLGNQAAAKKAYETFFAEWKNADADLPVMADARREYAQL